MHGSVAGYEDNKENENFLKNFKSYLRKKEYKNFTKSFENYYKDN